MTRMRSPRDRFISLRRERERVHIESDRWGENKCVERKKILFWTLESDWIFTFHECWRETLSSLVARAIRTHFSIMNRRRRELQKKSERSEEKLQLSIDNAPQHIHKEHKRARWKRRRGGKSKKKIEEVEKWKKKKKQSEYQVVETSDEGVWKWGHILPFHTAGCDGVFGMLDEMTFFLSLFQKLLKCNWRRFKIQTQFSLSSRLPRWF